MPLKETLNSIISMRKSEVEDLKIVQSDIAKKVQSLRDVSDMLSRSASDSEFADAYEQLKIQNPKLFQIKPDIIDDCIKAYEDADSSLSKLISRFSRGAITVTVIGESGAGKSMLLQTISGLTDTGCIPSYPGDSCTGVSSVIDNAVDFNDGQVEAKLVFKTEAEIVAEVNRKLETLKRNDIIIEKMAEIKNIDDNFAKSPDVQNQSKVFMNDYVKNYDKWSRFINASANGNVPPELAGYQIDSSEGIIKYIITDASAVKEYVAKQNGNYGDENKLYRYIALKDIMIKAKFHVDEAIDGLRLTDTVGFGDSSINAEELARNFILEADTDATVILLRTKNERTTISAQYASGLTKVFTDDHDQINKNIESTVALFVNNDNRSEDSLLRCNELLRAFNATCSSLSNKIKIAQIVDVSDVNELNESLNTFLKHLFANLKSVDSGIKTVARNKIEYALKLHRSMFAFDYTDIKIPDVDDRVDNVTNKALDEIVYGINGLLDSLSQKYNVHNSSVTKKIELVKEIDLKKIIEKTKISEVKANMGERTQIALEELLKAVREIGCTHDSEYERVEKELKKELAGIILDSIEFASDVAGELKASADSDFFDRMSKLMADNKAHVLADAFKAIDTFHLDEMYGLIKMLFNTYANEHILANNVNANTNTNDKDYDRIIECKLKESLDSFTSAISNLQLAKTNDDISTIRHIEAELIYFSFFFGRAYRLRWVTLFLKLFKEGLVFCDEKKNYEKYRGIYNDAKSIVELAMKNINSTVFLSVSID